MALNVKIKDREFVIICKKNTSNLKRLLDKVDNIKNKIINNKSILFLKLEEAQ